LLAGQGTRDAEAYDLVMRARHHLISDSEDGDLLARALYERAAALDPDFVEAHLGIASTYLRSAGAGYAPPAEAREHASAALERVLALDPQNVRARASRASLLFQRDWDWPAAEREFTSLTADPRLYDGVQYHAPAIFYLAIGRAGQAAAIVERALKTDPGNLESRVMLCDFLGEAGRLSEADGCYRAVANVEPSDARPLYGLAEILRRRADLPGAIQALRRAYELSGEEAGVRALTGARTEQDYRAAELTVARGRLEVLQADATRRYVSPLDLARLHALTGAREAAFADLERALAERSPMLVLLKVDRAWDAIRDDARFAAAVRRIGIP
jgi:tetratricopeptide (TPR) repeat protein